MVRDESSSKLLKTIEEVPVFHSPLRYRQLNSLKSET